MDDTNVTADAVIATAPAPVATPVIATAQTEVDPVEAKIKEAVAKAKADILQEAARIGQSGKDKRLNALQQELQAEKARTEALERALNTIPATLGPDADPSVVQNVRLAQTNARLSVYQQQELAQRQAAQLEAAKQAVLEDTREEITELGINPDDPRIAYDFTQPDAKAFRKKVMQGVRQIQAEDVRKSIPQLVAQEMAARDARAKEEATKARKESGVDSHDSPGVALSDDAAFMRSYAAGKSDDHARAQKILRKK